MWNPFKRRESGDRDFPKPEWPPIQALDDIDMAGKRKDGGVDLVIVASQPLDDTAATLDAIRRKVATYLDAIDSEAFQADMGHPKRDQIAIVITCDHPIHPNAASVIEECKSATSARGITLSVSHGAGAEKVSGTESERIDENGS